MKLNKLANRVPDRMYERIMENPAEYIQIQAARAIEECNADFDVKEVVEAFREHRDHDPV